MAQKEKLEILAKAKQFFRENIIQNYNTNIKNLGRLFLYHH